MADQSENHKAEYILLQGIYEDYDKRALSLKALATPLLGAGLAVGFKDMNPGVLLATITVAASLWLLEAIWKSFQYCHATRLKLLEHLFRTNDFADVPPFQIFDSWMSAWRGTYGRPSVWLKILCQPFVYLPYLLIIALGGIGIVWATVMP